MAPMPNTAPIKLTIRGVSADIDLAPYNVVSRCSAQKVVYISVPHDSDLIALSDHLFDTTQYVRPPKVILYASSPALLEVMNIV
jgi:hypothetical protein